MDDLPEDFVFFTYPKAEGRNIFLQGILFHELGHAIEWKKSISKSLFRAISWSNDNSTVPKIFENWVREIIADLIAVRLVGPAVLFSSRLAALTVGVLDNDSRSHPSSRFRFLWMLEHLDKLGYMNPESKATVSKVLSSWHADLKRADSNAAETSPEFQSVHSVLDDSNIKNKLHSLVEAMVPDPAYDAEVFGANVPAIVDNFESQLPHCGEGVDTGIHLASVFNAAWETNLRDQSQARKGETELAADREILCNLALKSIEGNYIQKLWREL